MSPRRPDLDGLDQEIRDHIDAETQDNIARGMTGRTRATRRCGSSGISRG